MGIIITRFKALASYLPDVVYLSICLLLYYSILFPWRGITRFDMSIFCTVDTPILITVLLIIFSLSLYISITLYDNVSIISSVTKITCLYIIVIIIHSFIPQIFKPEEIHYRLLTGIHLSFGPMLALLTIWSSYRAICKYQYMNILILLYIILQLYILSLMHSHPNEQANFFYQGIKRLSYIYFSPNHLGNVLSFSAITLYTYIIYNNLNKRLVLIVPYAILIHWLIMTFSRGAWLSFFVGIILTNVFLRPYKCLWRHLLVNCLTVIIVLVTLLTVPPHAVINRAKIKVSNDLSVKNRISVIYSSIKIIIDYPLYGVGLAGFNKAMESKYIDSYLLHENYSSAINNYMTLAVEAGIPISLLYIVTIIYLLRYSIKESIGYNHNQGVGIACAVIATLIFGLTTFTLNRVYANMLCWVSIGNLIAMRIRP